MPWPDEGGILEDRGDGALVGIHGSYPSGLIFQHWLRAYKQRIGPVPTWIHGLPLRQARAIFCHALERDRPLPRHLPGLAPATVRPPIAVLHIPHAATRIPPGLRRHLLPDDAALAEELRVMTDHNTDTLFPRTAWEAERVIFPWSRLVCDVERFVCDTAEPMSRQGMGAIYTSCHDGQPLRRPPDQLARDWLLRRLYWPHHARLAFAVGRTLARHGRCLLIDCHSFASRPLPHEPCQAPERPDICIGTDPFHTPPGLAQRIATLLEDQHGLVRPLSVAIDRPFAGALVPDPFHQSDRRVAALMIEVNRALYMDEASGTSLPGADRIRRLLARAISAAAALVADEAAPVAG